MDKQINVLHVPYPRTAKGSKVEITFGEEFTALLASASKASGFSPSAIISMAIAEKVGYKGPTLAHVETRRQVAKDVARHGPMQGSMHEYAGRFN